jgi:type II secretory pathway component GspD/PulD (secretin)
VEFLRLKACLIAVVMAAAVLRAQAPAPPPAQPSRAGQMPILPLTELDERALAADLDNKTFTLTFAQPVPVRDLLLLLVRDTALSMVPDPAISGSFIGELKNVTVRQALGLILPPLDLDYSVDGSFIRVFHREVETRLFDINYLAADRTAATITGGGADAVTSTRVTTTAGADVFADIAKGVQTLLSANATFNVDRKAGLVQVTDFPERLDRVQSYLDIVSDHVHRQVEIDARILEIELNGSDAPAIDFAALARGSDAARPPAAASRQMLSGLAPGDLPRFLTALAGAGKVSVLGEPHVLTLNNEPALVRATLHGGTLAEEEGVTLSVTPQIAGEGAITLSLSPIVSQQIADGSGKTPPLVSVRATDTVARLGDGATLVLGGFTRQRETRERQAGGTKGGWFGRSTVVTKKTIELVILLTPRIVSGAEAQ